MTERTAVKSSLLMAWALEMTIIPRCESPVISAWSQPLSYPVYTDAERPARARGESDARYAGADAMLMPPPDS